MILDILKGNISCYSDEDIEKIIKAFMYKNISTFCDDYSIVVLSSCELDKIAKFKNTLGLLSNDIIYLQREALLNLKNKDIEILRVIFHEIAHIDQERLILENVISYKAYLLIMDRIIIEKMGKEYQKKNYNCIFEEIDANIVSEINLYNYLSSNGLLFLDEIENIKNNILNNIEKLDITCRIFNSKYYDKEKVFDDIIKNNQKYLSYYPLLNFYYYEDGSKISLSNIIIRTNMDFDNIIDEKIFEKIKKLDDSIIKNRSGNEENIEKDIQSLINLKSNDKEIINKKNTSLERLIGLKNNDYVNNIIDVYDSILTEIFSNLLPNKIRKK